MARELPSGDKSCMDAPTAFRATNALVLSGGGNRGAMEAGALMALFERDIAPDLVVGSSAGAINAAYIAGHPSLNGARCLTGVWRGIRTQDVFPGPRPAVLWRLFRHRDRLHDPEGLARILRAHLPYSDLAGASVPVVVVATELDTGRECWLSSGDAVRAILASTALPGVFPPVCIDGRRYIDGGVTNRVPISVAAAAGAKTIYVLDVGYPCKCQRLHRNIIDIAMQATAIMGTQRFLADLEYYRLQGLDIVHIPLPCHLAVRFTDFSHTDEMIEDAYQLTCDALDRQPPACRLARANRERRVRWRLVQPRTRALTPS